MSKVIICDATINDELQKYNVIYIQNQFAILITPSKWYFDEYRDFVKNIIANTYKDANIIIKDRWGFRDPMDKLKIEDIKLLISESKLHKKHMIEINSFYSSSTQQYAIASKMPYLDTFYDKELFNNSFRQTRDFIENEQLLKHLTNDIYALYSSANNCFEAQEKITKYGFNELIKHLNNN
jgi:hypothetical protein